MVIIMLLFVMDDVYLSIFKFLNLNGMRMLSLVDKNLNNIFHSEILWCHVYVCIFNKMNMIGNFYETCGFYIRLLKCNDMFVDHHNITSLLTKTCIRDYEVVNKKCHY